MILIIIILSVLLVIALFKWFLYYCGVRALAYRLIEKHQDEIPDLEDLTNKAINQVIKERFHIKKIRRRENENR